MTAAEPAALFGIADRVLELVRAAAPSAEAEVTVETGTMALTRFANSAIHQNVAEEVASVALRVALAGRVAAARLDGTDDASLRRLVDDALSAAAARPVDPDWPGVAAADGGDPAAAAVDHWDDATGDAEPAERAARVRAFVDAAGGLETAGACATEGRRVAFATSAGCRRSGRATIATLAGIARTPTADGSGRMASVRLDAIDGAAVGRVAADKARAASDPTELEPGRYEVVLEPACVADVLGFLFLYGFNARTVQEGRSFVELGQQQFDAAITLRDDAADPEQVGLGFDPEGTLKQAVTVVAGGVTTALLHDRRTAARSSTRSTGHAQGPGPWVPGAAPANVVLEPGGRSSAELVASVRRGLLVTDLHYTRILDPRTEVVTGLTRNGVWLVEDGRIVRPVRNLRFTQSYLDALAPGAVLGVASDRALIDLRDDGGAMLVPALHLASWNFTGGSRG
jgi:predicted Zn-dependent protease